MLYKFHPFLWVLLNSHAQDSDLSKYSIQIQNSTRPTQKGDFPSWSAEYVHEQPKHTHNYFSTWQCKTLPYDDAHHIITSSASTLN